MKNQALFSSKDKYKEFICRLLQFLLGALRVKKHLKFSHLHYHHIKLYTQFIGPQSGTLQKKSSYAYLKFRVLYDCIERRRGRVVRAAWLWCRKAP